MSNPRAVVRYATRFEGDHSLDAATVTESISAPCTLYTVRLQFASGAEQSISVTAPPGGLQPEMRDMSGDSVANDLALTSKLLGLPPIVLLNEGHGVSGDFDYQPLKVNLEELQLKALQNRPDYVDISQQDRAIAEYAYKRGAASLVDFFGRRTQLSRHPARLPPSPSCLTHRSGAGARGRGREKLAVI